jgi:hypothetical protein
MAKKASQTPARRRQAERKRRTREHVIADLSIHHVEGLVLRAGYTVQRMVADYGYDLCLITHNEEGEVENDYIHPQLKSTDRLARYEMAGEEAFSFPVSSKDYRLWSSATLPVLLILYDTRTLEAYWLDVRDYDRSHRPEVRGQSINLHIPRSHVLGVQTIRLMRQRKQLAAQGIPTPTGRRR